MGNQLSPSFVALLAAVDRKNRQLRGPSNKKETPAEAGRPSRDRTKVKAARKQNRQRKGGKA